MRAAHPTKLQALVSQLCHVRFVLFTTKATKVTKLAGSRIEDGRLRMANSSCDLLSSILYSRPAFIHFVSFVAQTSSQQTRKNGNLSDQKFRKFPYVVECFKTTNTCSDCFALVL